MPQLSMKGNHFREDLLIKDELISAIGSSGELENPFRYKNY